MQGICALTGELTELKLSHIFPKFSVRYIRDTSNNGLLRSYKNINLARQDGLKVYLLGESAEKLFSKAETWFANNFFYPVVNGQKKGFSYDNHLYYFAISLLWRGLLIQLKEESIINESYFPQLQEAEKQWRSFLLDGYIPPVYRHSYMMIIHPDSMHAPSLKNMQYYLLRNLDATIVTNDSNCVYMYIKLPRFLFWAPIITYNHSIPNHIDILGGCFNSREVPSDPVINGFIRNRVLEVNNLQSQLSDEQKKATLNRISKDKEGFLASEAGQLLKKGL